MNDEEPVDAALSSFIVPRSSFAMIPPVKHKLRRHPPLSSFATTGG